MLTFSMLLQILEEAESRRDDQSLPQDARDRSAETVSLCKQRMAKEGPYGFQPLVFARKQVELGAYPDKGHRRGARKAHEKL